VFTPAGTTAYVMGDGSTLGAEGTVTPIGTATGKPGAAIDVGGFPTGITFGRRDHGSP
jgi:DNA-binding beta-propeller fold protein YncE